MNISNNDLRELVLLARSTKFSVNPLTSGYLIPVERMEVFQRVLRENFGVDYDAPWEDLRKRFHEH